jgi:O-antigen/teichoic acid export membrane protein
LNLDRLIIGAFLSVAAVAYYSTPFDLLSRLTLIPGALSLVLFPAFAFTLSQDRNLAAHRLKQGIKFTFLVLFPIVYFLILFAPELMNLWVGPEFAMYSAPIARILGFGVLIMSLAYIPVVMLQAAGRSDFTAKLQLFELPLYVAALWVLTDSMGLLGAAIAFLGRATLDSIVSLYGCERLGNKGILQESAYAIGFAAAVVLPSLFVSGVLTRSILFAAVVIVFSIAVFKKGISGAERELLVGRFRTISRSQVRG